MDRWSIRRRAVSIAVLMLVLGTLAVVPGMVTTVRAVALLGDVILRAPVRPLAYLTPAPATETLEWGDDGLGALTLPGGTGPHPGLVVMLGAEPAEPEDPRVRRLTDGLARSGLATLLVRSPRLIDGALTPDEAGLLVEAFRALRGDPRVHADRVAFVGLSVGGSIAMVAAADPTIAEHVWFVLAIGPHYDGRTLVASVAGHAYRNAGAVVSWSPHETATGIVTRTLLAALPEGDRAAIVAGRAPSGADGTIVRDLLRARDLDEAERLVARLGPGMQAAIDAVSPRLHLAGLRTPLYLLHDRNDAFIPWPESEAIAAVAHPAVYERLDLFEHVDPHPRSAAVLLRDGWRLLRLFSRILASAADPPP